MKKLLLTVLLCCLTLPAWAAQEINAGISGTWFNRDKDGHGFAVEFTDCRDPDGCLTVFWFTYSPNGEPIFLLGNLPVDDNVAKGTLRYYWNQTFGTFTPKPEHDDWGTLRLKFSSCKKGTARYVADDYVSADGDTYSGSDQFPIERLSSIGTLDCNNATQLADIKPNDVAGRWTGLALPENDRDGARGIRGVVTPDKQAYFDGFGAYLATGKVVAEQKSKLAAYPVFDFKLPNGENQGHVNVTLEYDEPDRLEGSYNIPGEDGRVKAPLLLRYEASYGRDADLSRIDGCWSLIVSPGPQAALWITSKGKLSASLKARNEDGEVVTWCKLRGSVKPYGDGRFNVFDATIKLSQCQDGRFNGTFTGILWAEDVGIRNEDKFLQLRLHDGRWGFLASGTKFDDSQCGR